MIKISKFLSNEDLIRTLVLAKDLNYVARNEREFTRRINNPFKHFLADKYNISKNVAKHSIIPKGAFNDKNPNVNCVYLIEDVDSYKRMAMELSELLVRYGRGIANDVDITYKHYFENVIA